MIPYLSLKKNMCNTSVLPQRTSETAAFILFLFVLIPLRASGQELAASMHRQVEKYDSIVELTSENWRPLDSKEKFQGFEHDLFHWGTQASLVFNTSISAATSSFGFSSYLRLYSLNAADECNFVFFNGFLFPTVFHEDPRYIPRDRGSVRQRLAYALTRTVVARSDSGKPKFNATRLLGTLAATSLSSSYYYRAGADVSIKSNFVNYGINLGSETAMDMLKEFWPDVARKLKLNVWIRNAIRHSLRDSIGSADSESKS
jgi:hypothetical protein